MYDCYVSMKVRDTIFKEWETYAHQWAMDRLFGHQGMQAGRKKYQCILDLVYSVRILCGV